MIQKKARGSASFPLKLQATSSLFFEKLHRHLIHLLLPGLQKFQHPALSHHIPSIRIAISTLQSQNIIPHSHHLPFHKTVQLLRIKRDLIGFAHTRIMFLRPHQQVIRPVMNSNGYISYTLRIIIYESSICNSFLIFL